MKLFEYAVIYTPDEESPDKPKLVVPVTTVIASNKEGATLMAARSIPEEYVDKLDRLEVAVRPF